MANPVYFSGSVVKPLSALLIGGALLLVAETCYYFFGLYLGDEGGAAASPQRGGDAITQSLQQIRKYPLFSLSATKQKTQSAAPVTKLQLQLFGIALDLNTKQSSALIKVQSKKPRVFHTQDSLGSGIRLHAIERDHVLIERRGTLETLAFPRHKGNLVRTSQRGPDTRRSEASRRRSRAPQATQQIVASTVQAVTPKSVGFQTKEVPLLMEKLSIDGSGLYRPKDGGGLGQLIGLKDGDQIMSVNGKAFGSLLSNPGAVAAIAGTGKVQLSVRRGGEDIVITTALP